MKLLIMKEEKHFGPLRKIFWPIYPEESKKVSLMLLLLFFLCSNYTILRNLKDSLLLSAKHSGAEVIPFIKVWGMLPAAFLAAWSYTRLLNYFSREKTFYLIISFYIIYLSCFALYIFPHSESLNFTDLQIYLLAKSSPGFSGLISMFCNWTISTFYIISELWATLLLAICFWGFVNEYSKVSEAKRYYGLLNVGSNSAPALGGMIAILLIHYLQLPFLKMANETEDNVLKLTFFVVILSLLSMLLFYKINRIVEKENGIETKTAKEKKKQSMRESFRLIAKSRYLTSLAFIVLAYNIAINFSDVLWKSQVKRYFTDPTDIFILMNKVQMGVGIIATLLAFLFSTMIRHFGWGFVGLLTPILMSFLALAFFTFIYFENLADKSYLIFSLSPLAFSVYLGAIQNCLSKAGKYSVFDASKELAFLKLDKEERSCAKASIDGLGSSLGKSGASLSYEVLIISFGSIAASTSYISAILFLVYFFWILAARHIAKQF